MLFPQHKLQASVTLHLSCTQVQYRNYTVCNNSKTYMHIITVPLLFRPLQSIWYIIHIKCPTPSENTKKRYFTNVQQPENQIT